MHHLKLALLSGLLITVLATLLFRVTGANTASAQSCSWRAVSAPNPSSNDQLNAIAASSATDAWTVGFYYTSSNDVATLIEHWNGTQWSIVGSPNSTSYDELNAVTALSATDAWAVGPAFSSIAATLIEHWNGTQWSIVKSPNLSSGTLDGISAVASNNVWAVGGAEFLHWNGTSWQVVKGPQAPNGDYYQLNGIAAVSASNVWAVGDLNSNTGYEPVIEHWNGTSWSVVSSPNLSSSSLQAVAASSANDVWAVGSTLAQTLIEHWNGTAWSVVKSSNPGSSNELEGVAVFSTTSAWTVGSYGSYETLTEDWGGTSWSTVASPNPGGSDRLTGVAVVPGSNQVWAEGIHFATNGDYQTLTELYC